MTKTLEKNLWSWLKTGKNKHFKLYELTRIENGTGESGMPDVVFCHKGRAGFVELKTTKDFSKKGTINLKMTGKQAYFQNRWSRCGGNVKLLIRVGKNKHYLIDGMDVYWRDANPTLTKKWLDDYSILFDENVGVADILQGLLWDGTGPIA